MQNLYIITGPAGVGKTTVSEKLANSLEKSVLIEGDLIYSQVIGGYQSAWKEGNHLKTFWDVCFSMIQIYLNDGFDVIFNYIVTPNIITRFKNEFNKYDTKFVILLTDESTLLKRDSLRPLDCQMKERCIILLNNFKKHNYDKNNILDTSNLSIDKTVEIIKADNKFSI